MSLRRADRTGFVELVTDFFLELRGGGLMLSAADREQLRVWDEAGLSAELVCRALQAAGEAFQEARPGVRPPRHLAYYAGAVADAVRAEREKSVGA